MSRDVRSRYGRGIALIGVGRMGSGRLVMVGVLSVPVLFLAACAASPGGDSRIITARAPVGHQIEDIVGTVTAMDGCASLGLPGGAVHPVIWQLGFEVQPDGVSVGDNNGTVALDEELTQSRGYLIDAAELDEFDEPVDLTGFDQSSPDSTTFLVLTQVEDFDTPE